MRIGVMLRHYDQHGGGVKVYTSRLMRALLDLRTEHEFVLLYRNPALLGTYTGERGVEEVALAARSVLGWDQLAVPEAVRRHGKHLFASAGTSWLHLHFGMSGDLAFYRDDADGVTFSGTMVAAVVIDLAAFARGAEFAADGSGRSW